MKAEIKYLYSPDVDDLKNFKPKEVDNFGFLLQMMIGIKGKEGEESFDIIVCTPKWMMDKQYDFVLGGGYLFIRFYDYIKLREFLEKIINSIDGEDWQQIANKISKVAHWEFEDYEE